MNYKMFPIEAISIVSLLFYCCNSTDKKQLQASSKNAVVSNALLNKVYVKDKKKADSIVIDSNSDFEKKIYLKVDKILSGQVYTNRKGQDVFYRILEIPEEENLTLFAENISIGEEGGKYQLIRRIRLTDENSVFSKFGLSSVDSLRFIDPITIEGYFNKLKVKINLNTLKKN